MNQSKQLELNKSYSDWHACSFLDNIFKLLCLKVWQKRSTEKSEENAIKYAKVVVGKYAFLKKTHLCFTQKADCSSMITMLKPYQWVIYLKKKNLTRSFLYLNPLCFWETYIRETRSHIFTQLLILARYGDTGLKTDTKLSLCLPDLLCTARKLKSLVLKYDNAHNTEVTTVIYLAWHLLGFAGLVTALVMHLLE